MIRTAASVTISAALFAIFASASACSSTSTNDDDKGGTGAVIGGSGGTGNGGSGGTTATGGTAGSVAMGCPGMPITCVDAMTAKACDADDMLVTVSCKEEFAKSGLISNGCTTEATGSGCTIDGGMDKECWLGAQGVATCDTTVTEDDFLNIYYNCFSEDPTVRPIVTCIAGYVDEAAKMVDCDGAEMCLPDNGMGGAGPDGGAGAGPDPSAGGAGGAP